jgi:hypothetical protein
MGLTPAAEKQLFARCFLRIEGWLAIQVDSSGQRLAARAQARFAKSGAIMKRISPVPPLRLSPFDSPLISC